MGHLLDRRSVPCLADLKECTCVVPGDILLSMPLSVQSTDGNWTSSFKEWGWVDNIDEFYRSVKPQYIYALNVRFR